MYLDFRPSHSVYPSQRIIPKGNVAAVEPYIHMPQQKPIAMMNKQHKQHAKMVQDLAHLKLNLQDSNNQKNVNSHTTLNNIINNNNNSNVNVNHIQFPESDETKLARQMLHMKQHSQDFDLNANADMTDFVTSNKSDGKSQTLSYNINRPTKCSASSSITSMGISNILTATATTTTTVAQQPPPSTTTRMSTAGKIIAMSKDSFDDVESMMNFNSNDCDSAKVEHETDVKEPKSGLQRPSGQTAEILSAINKTASSTIHTSNIPTCGNQRFDGKTGYKSKIASPHQIPSGNLVVPPRKPISSVAPTSITPSVKSTIPSPRVHAVAPNINSTPILSTAEPFDKSRPALPPKPNKNNDNNSSSSSSSNESSPSSTSSSSSSSSLNGSSIANVNRSKSSTAIPTTITSYEKTTNNDKIHVDNVHAITSHIQAHKIDFPIKAKPLTIKKQPLSEQPRLRSLASGIKPIQYSSRRIEMPSQLLFPENDNNNKFTKPTVDDSKKQQVSSFNDDNKIKSPSASSNSSIDENEKSPVNSDGEKTLVPQTNDVIRRQKTSMSDNTKVKLTRRVSFDPLALLLDASLEGELELVQKTATQVNLIYRHLFFVFIRTVELKIFW